MLIEYDYQNDDGAIEWLSVAFDDVLYFSYKDAPCCDGEDVLDPDIIACLGASLLKKKVIANWQEIVGWQEYQKSLGGADRFQHFKIYFDDAGCIDVIASSCCLGGYPIE